ncbi:hypothetical protein RFI_21366 [Reticulomyxa filosa]|uniref:Uncharacterized protein n=1 Tax=Reticulomyxa filosa TaxID=46433 RepID=X6MQ81_RETFI|nr:hypothetical protein RFI_21366 [Reticulomyxa filosa]|eukprot:ETO15994.1 hypothetical protein RFI_21366 [Reticulomyxa filosa]
MSPTKDKDKDKDNKKDTKESENDPICLLKLQDIAAFRYVAEMEKDWIYHIFPSPMCQMVSKVWNQVRDAVSALFINYELDLLPQSGLEKWLVGLVCLFVCLFVVFNFYYQKKKKKILFYA